MTHLLHSPVCKQQVMLRQTLLQNDNTQVTATSDNWTNDIRDDHPVKRAMCRSAWSASQTFFPPNDSRKHHHDFFTRHLNPLAVRDDLK